MVLISPDLASLVKHFSWIWKGNWAHPMGLGKTSNNWVYVFKFLFLGDNMGAQASSQSWSAIAGALGNREWQQLSGCKHSTNKTQATGENSHRRMGKFANAAPVVLRSCHLKVEAPTVCPGKSTLSLECWKTPGTLEWWWWWLSWRFSIIHCLSDRIQKWITG